MHVHVLIIFCRTNQKCSENRRACPHSGSRTLPTEESAGDGQGL